MAEKWYCNPNEFTVTVTMPDSGNAVSVAPWKYHRIGAFRSRTFKIRMEPKDAHPLVRIGMLRPLTASEEKIDTDDGAVDDLRRARIRAIQERDRQLEAGAAIAGANPAQGMYEEERYLAELRMARQAESAEFSEIDNEFAPTVKMTKAEAEGQYVPVDINDAAPPVDAVVPGDGLEKYPGNATAPPIDAVEEAEDAPVVEVKKKKKKVKSK